MLFLLFLAALSFVATSFLGYVVHWAVHQRWAGIFYRAHLDHHTRYTSSDFFSETYRDSGIYNTTYYFILLFSPLILGIIGSVIVGWLSIWAGLVILASMSTVGLLNIYVHDGLHLYKSRWHYLPGIQKLIRLHQIHHKFTQKNLGIFTFLWDKLFGTYRDQ